MSNHLGRRLQNALALVFKIKPTMQIVQHNYQQRRRTGINNTFIKPWKFLGCGTKWLVEGVGVKPGYCVFCFQSHCGAAKLFSIMYQWEQLKSHVNVIMPSLLFTVFTHCSPTRERECDHVLSTFTVFIHCSPCNFLLFYWWCKKKKKIWIRRMWMTRSSPNPPA